MRRFSLFFLISALVCCDVLLAVADDNTVTITSQPLLTVQVGHLYEYQVVAVTNPPGLTVMYELHDGPQGMTIDQMGLIQWMPTRTGAFRVEVRVRTNNDSPNDDGGEAEQRYTLDVLTGGPSTLQGIVRNQQGMGVADVHVRMFEVSSSHFLFDGLTDSAGNYSIMGVNPGTYLLRASPPPRSIYADQWFNGVRRIQDATPVVVPESSTVAINFVLFPRDSNVVFLLSGCVSDTGSQPIPRALVSIFRVRQNGDRDGSGLNFEGLDDDDRDQRLVVTLVTDSLGNYSTHLPSRRYIVSARKDGFVTQFWNHKTNPLEADRLDLIKDTMMINFNLGQSPVANAVITGMVTSRENLSPLRAHVIGFHRQTANGRFTGFVRHAETDSLGVYSLRDLRDGLYVVLAVPEGEFLPTFYDTTGGTTDLASAFPVPVNNNMVSGINIMAFPDTVGGMNRVQGVVSSSGVGVPGAILYAYNATTNDIAGATVSEENGVYRLVGLAPGSYRIGGAKPGYESSLSPAMLIQYNGNMPATATQNIVLGNPPTDAAGNSGTRPGAFALEQNYPNPFNPSTTIAYSVTAVSHISLKVFNLLGQEVATLVNDLQGPGAYRVTFDASRLASGVYMYRLQAGSFTDMKKMMIIK